MYIQTNTKQNVYVLFQGYGENAYIVFNNFWGVIATANIKKEYIGNIKNGVVIDLFIDESQGAYFIKDIKRIINKMENQYIDKKVSYNIIYKSDLRNKVLKANIITY